ncbi:MAG: hypothetical protein KGL97_02555 [Alphaproteobacteria bacterium]|nr:hypothetical protein [Alphaproteobacteria bacterium]
MKLNRAQSIWRRRALCHPSGGVDWCELPVLGTMPDTCEVSTLFSRHDIELPIHRTETVSVRLRPLIRRF